MPPQTNSAFFSKGGWVKSMFKNIVAKNTFQAISTIFYLQKEGAAPLAPSKFGQI